eukprot:TRINITY_DN7444_c0_g1_i1.p1 TRINITY_DN7444_c0_g1~~TRINITY_DN7444_c0_g1_i1.p1  ORF type:complete len:344 (+),score=43.66 TRINITY_DN7444_c0_g1_i1:37-1032(+)
MAPRAVLPLAVGALMFFVLYELFMPAADIQAPHLPRPELPNWVRAERNVSGVIATLYNESPRAKGRFFESIRSWDKHLLFARGKYPIVIFYLTGVENELSEADKTKLRQNAPHLQLEFYPVRHVIPEVYRRMKKKILENQMPKRGFGYIFCSQFLGFEMFLQPRIKEAEYILRLDDDISFDHDAAFDVFADMHKNNIAVGWNCIKAQWNKSSAHMDERIVAFVDSYRQSGRSISPLYKENMPGGVWNLRLYAGCVELYKADVFVNPEYFSFLEKIDMMEGIYLYSWMEQAYKTLWMEISVPPQNWKRYACELPTLHRHTRDTWFDYEGCPA